MKDVLGAMKLLFFGGYAGLHLESDVLPMLERGTGPGESREGLMPTPAQTSELFIRTLPGTGAGHITGQP